MASLREIENRFFSAVRAPATDQMERARPQVWDASALVGHKYCLLTSYRRDGRAVHTPVWFGADGECIYVRSAGQDGKVKRIRRDGRVLVTPCGARGTPLGAPMEGCARILEAAEHRRAEAALVRAYGLGRRFYRLVRRRIEVVYLEIGPNPTV